MSDKLPYEPPTLTPNTILSDLFAELRRQAEKFPDCTWDFPNGTGAPGRSTWRKLAQGWCKRAEREGHLTWTDIFDEETAEVMEETEDEKIDRELVQVMAVAYRWRQAIAARRSKT